MLWNLADGLVRTPQDNSSTQGNGKPFKSFTTNRKSSASDLRVRAHNIELFWKRSLRRVMEREREGGGERGRGRERERERESEGREGGREGQGDAAPRPCQSNLPDRSRIR